MRPALPILAALLGAAGCSGPVDNPTRTESFATSAPPPGYVEAKMKARASAPKPGKPAEPNDDR